MRSATRARPAQIVASEKTISPSPRRTVRLASPMSMSSGFATGTGRNAIPRALATASTSWADCDWLIGFITTRIRDRSGTISLTNCSLSFAKTPSARQALDLSPLIREQSRSHDQRAAPPASPPPLPLRWPPPPRRREPRLAPATRRVQADAEPAPAPAARSPLLGLVVQDLASVEAGPRHRGARRRPTLAATSLSPALRQALRTPPPPAARPS